MKLCFDFARRLSLPLAGAIGLAVISACSDDTGPKGVGTPASIEVASAPVAASVVAATIQGPAVIVKDASGQPLAGVEVRFDVEGGGAVQFPIVTTDADGFASAGLWRIGPSTGANIVTATVEGLPPVTFTLASSAGPVAQVISLARAGRSYEPGTAINLDFRVADAGGNGIAGQPVTLAVTAGGGTLSVTSGTTNASGLISTTLTLPTGQCWNSVRVTSGTFVADFTASTRGTISIGGSASGALAPGDCVIDGKFADEYSVTTSSAAIDVSMTATFNPLAQVTTLEGTPVATGSSFRLIPAAGKHAVRATSVAAGETGSYTVTTALSASSAVTNCSAPFIEIGASTTQALATTDCTDDLDLPGDPFLLYVPAGVTVTVSETAQPLDAELLVFRPNGTLLADRDNGGVGASGTERITFTAATAGIYRIVASSYCVLADDHYQANCDYGAYTLSVIKP